MIGGKNQKSKITALLSLKQELGKPTKCGGSLCGGLCACRASVFEGTVLRDTDTALLNGADSFGKTAFKELFLIILIN